MTLAAPGMPGQNASRRGACASSLSAPARSSSLPWARTRFGPSCRSTSSWSTRSPPGSTCGCAGAAVAKAPGGSPSALTLAATLPARGWRFQLLPLVTSSVSVARCRRLRSSTSASRPPRALSIAGGMASPARRCRSSRSASNVATTRSRPGWPGCGCQSSVAARLDLSSRVSFRLAVRSGKGACGNRPARASRASPWPAPVSSASSCSSVPCAWTCSARPHGSAGSSGFSPASSLPLSLPLSLAALSLAVLSLASSSGARHSGDSGPLPCACKSRLAVSGHGWARLATSRRPCARSVPTAWVTRRLSRVRRAPWRPAARLACSSPALTGSGSPSWRRTNSPRLRRSSASSTGRRRANGSSLSGGGVAGVCRPTSTRVAASSRTCSSRWPSARHATSSRRSSTATSTSATDRRIRSTRRPRSTLPRTPAISPSSCRATVSSSRRVPFCDATVQNTNPHASAASMATPGTHQTRMWRTTPHILLKTRSPTRSAAAGRVRAGRTRRPGTAGRPACARARRRHSPRRCPCRRRIRPRRPRRRTRLCPSVH
ncbi:surface antigen family domain protein [Bordetella bronchiseptica]|nr:surface antigen family domain protein [Bordetella bronchiseptica]